MGKYLLFDDNKRPASMCKEKESHSVFQWGNTASSRAILCTCYAIHNAPSPLLPELAQMGPMVGIGQAWFSNPPPLAVVEKIMNNSRMAMCKNKMCAHNGGGRGDQ